MKLNHRSAMLWVLVGCERAIGCYESRGWRADGTLREAEVWGMTLPERRFVRMIQKSDASP